MTAAIARVVVLESVRGRVPWLVAAVMLGGVALSALTAEVAITESREIARGLLGAWLRLASVFVVALFVSSSVVRDFNDKGMELVLALPVPRSAWLAGRLAGYAVVALVCAAAATALLLAFVPPGQALLWGATLACELLLVSVLAVLCVLTLHQVTLALSAVLGFYLLSRVMDALVLIGSNPLVTGEQAQTPWLTRILEVIAFLLPDLDRFARAQWLIDGSATAADLGHALVQTGIYLTLLGGAALFDLQRKVL